MIRYNNLLAIWEEPRPNKHSDQTPPHWLDSHMYGYNSFKENNFIWHLSHRLTLSDSLTSRLSDSLTSRLSDFQLLFVFTARILRRLGISFCQFGWPDVNSKFLSLDDFLVNDHSSYIWARHIKHGVQQYGLLQQIKSSINLHRF